ncbi:hypothetical protein HO173_006259 [Letharia columbiana]|uniref:Uncharacterized protein n=1 Tax=Letharia columbiana TaxID=112416 RepID=A0A8H6FVP5_9LECA|nr:uncharacterized protein HO173_006259 [Letharia columbiana]KAF6235576.1 hypothetical protein HO173_006259 [Letharia columbiana]
MCTTVYVYIRAGRLNTRPIRLNRHEFVPRRQENLNTYEITAIYSSGMVGKECYGSESEEVESVSKRLHRIDMKAPQRAVRVALEIVVIGEVVKKDWLEEVRPERRIYDVGTKTLLSVKARKSCSDVYCGLVGTEVSRKIGQGNPAAILEQKKSLADDFLNRMAVEDRGGTPCQVFEKSLTDDQRKLKILEQRECLWGKDFTFGSLRP